MKTMITYGSLFIAILATIFLFLTGEQTEEQLEVFTVSYVTGFETELETEDVLEGSSHRLPNLFRVGYTFDGWSYTEDGNVIEELVELTEDTVFYAIFTELTVEPNQYVVTLVNTATLESTEQTYVEGELFSFTESSVEGYTFDGLFNASTMTLVENGDLVTSSMVVYVQYTQDEVLEEYKVTLIDLLTGDVEEESYIEGETLSFDAVDIPGYTFSGWFTTNDTSGVLMSNGDEVTSNLTLYAQYTENSTTAEYTVTFYSNGGEVIDPEVVVSGSVVSEPVSPSRTGLIFTGWVYDCGFDGLENTCKDYDFTQQVTEDLALYASYSYIIPMSAYTIEALYTENYNGDHVFLAGYYIHDIDVDQIPMSSYLEDGKLVDIVLPTSINGNKIIGVANNVFTDLEFTSLTIPEGYLFIGDFAFEESSVDDLYLPSSLNAINDEAFLRATIGALHFDNGSNLKIIGYEAFRNAQLGDFVVPSSVIIIDYNAFRNAGFSSFTFEENSKLLILEEGALRGTNLSSITLPNQLRTIAYNVFSQSDLTSITIPESVVRIESNAFNGSLLNDVIMTGDNQWEFVSDLAFEGTPLQDNNTDELFIVGSLLMKYNQTDYTLEKDIIIPEGVIAIAKRAFQNEVSQYIYEGYTINSISFPSTLRYIGDSAFASFYNFNTSTLERIAFNSFPDLSATNLAIIEYYAFEGVILPNNTDISLPSTLVYTEANIFGNVTARDVFIPATNSPYLFTQAFRGATLESVTFEDGLLEIPSSILYEATVTTVNIPNSIETIHSNALNATITNFNIEDGIEIKKVNSNAFMYTNDFFASQTGDIISFANVALRYTGTNTGTENVVLNADPLNPTVTTLATLFNARNVNPLNVASIDFTGIKYFNENALSISDAMVSSVQIPSDVVSFEVSSMQAFTFNVLPKIEFLGNDSYTELYNNVLLGNKDFDFSRLGFAFNNDSSKFSDDENGYTVHHNVLVSVNNVSGEDYVVPEGVQFIANNVFENKTINSITLPSSLISIGKAFVNTVISTEVIIPASVIYISASAFLNAQLLEGILFEDPTTLRYVGKDIFENSDVVTYDQDGFFIIDGVLFDYAGLNPNIVIPEGVLVIATEAFEKQSIEVGNDANDYLSLYLFETITLPSTLKVLSENAFEPSEYLFIELADNLVLDFIGYYAIEDYRYQFLPQGIVVAEQDNPFN